jgi:hypothetical protein
MEAALISEKLIAMSASHFRENIPHNHSPSDGTLTKIQVAIFNKFFKRLRSRKFAGSRHDAVNEFFSIYVILSAALRLGVYSASNRNEYQKQKNNVSGE